MLELSLESVEQTRALGALVGESARPGGVVALNGELGVGKTVFAQGVGLALGVEGAITSPTFVLVNTYESGRLPLVHADMYRLEAESEATAIGLDEQLESDVVGLVEWAERFPEVLPADHLEVWLGLVAQAPDLRVVRLAAKGRQSADWLLRLEPAIRALLGD